MRVYTLEREQLLARPIDEVFEFFAQARNLERITPPLLRFVVLTPDPLPMHVGTLIDYRLRVHGLPIRWTSRIDEWVRGKAFVDRQVSGPYALWHHRHTFAPAAGGTLVRDRVRYALPFGVLGRIAHGLFVRRDLERIFEFRYAAVQRELE